MESGNAFLETNYCKSGRKLQDRDVVFSFFKSGYRLLIVMRKKKNPRFKKKIANREKKSPRRKYTIYSNLKYNSCLCFLYY